MENTKMTLKVEADKAISDFDGIISIAISTEGCVINSSHQKRFTFFINISYF